jgi:hypothetical protein
MNRLNTNEQKHYYVDFFTAEGVFDGAVLNKTAPHQSVVTFDWGGIVQAP